ncbi:transglutaminase-like domain-containing protein [Flavitalea sp.]|nr:hypothetical protein [Flavitalea sp.]
MRKKLPDSYALQLSYNELYLDAEALRIKDAQSDEDKLIIHLGGLTRNLATNIPQSHFSDSSTLVFNAKDSARLFWIKQDGFSDSAQLSITYSPTAIYLAAGNSEKSNFEINSSSLIFSDARLTSHKLWAFDFFHNGNYTGKSEEPVMKLTDYLRDSIGIVHADPGLTRLQKIFSHLWPFVRANMGVPADSLNGKAPLELISLLKTGKVKVWCGNISSLLGAMTNAAGLSTRLVTTEGYESFAYPVHSFNEVFLPEYGTWIYTDLTNGVAYLETAGKPLNTVQLNRVLRSGIEKFKVEAITFRDSIQHTDIDSLPVLFKGYFAAPQRFRFYYPQYLREQNLHSIWNRVKRFVKPSYNYAYYSEDNHYASTSFWLRSLSGYLLILMIFVNGIAVSLILWRWKRRAQNKKS